MRESAIYHFDWIKRHAERTPDKLALVDAHSGRQFTYAQFDERANRLASFLQNTLGVQRGDRVSLLAQNSSDYYAVLFGCGKMGAILNTLNWQMDAPELERVINDCKSRLLIYEPDFAGAVRAIKPHAACEAYVVLADESWPDEWTYTDALATGSPGGVPMPPLTFDDVWAIIYTSGTTGLPKGAQVTFGNFFYNAISAGQAVGLTYRDVNLNVLPTFHTSGLGLYACPTLYAGGTVVVMRAFDPKKFLQLINRWQVTAVFLTPSIYLTLAEAPDFDQYDLSSVRCWSGGGSALPPSLVHQFAAKGIIIQQGFGMTETGPSVFFIAQQDAVRKAGSVGKPVLHTDVCIMDRDHNVLGPNEVGELCIRGGNVTPGYWNRPAANEATMVDGWLHSGDAARYDEEGFYYIVDH